MLSRSIILGHTAPMSLLLAVQTFYKSGLVTAEEEDLK